MIWFEEPLIGRASKAITVSEGRVHSCSYTENPRSPASFMPFIILASRLELGLVEGQLADALELRSLVRSLRIA
jgi:hypothetical protein